MSDSNPPPLPSTYRGLICSGVGQPLTVQSIPMPDAVPGSVIVRILTAAVDSQVPHVLAGEVPGFTFPNPFIPGARAIGRVAAVGPDTTSLEVNQLVMLEPFIRGRDDPDVQILWGVFEGPSPASKKLMADSWRYGTFAEYTRAPLENCHPLNEKALLGSLDEGGLGYSVDDLNYLPKHLISYGGFRGIDLKAGETVIIAPATGGYSGAAVEVACAMGARVIAVGRNLSALQKIAAVNARVTAVQLKGDVQEDIAALKKLGPIDAYLDISPGTASNSTHVRSCLMALRPYGRASLMGVISSDIAIPYVVAVFNNLTIRGQYMYEREDVRGIIKLAESGLLRLGANAGHQITGQFPLEEWEEAIQNAKENPEAGKLVLFKP